MVAEGNAEEKAETTTAGPGSEATAAATDPATLHPLSPEVISRQATINIGEHF